MGNLGLPELLVLLLILAIFFGAKRIPELGASLGKGIRAFKSAVNDAPQPETKPSPGPDEKKPS